MNDIASQLEKLGKLVKNNTITQGEFETIKSKLIHGVLPTRPVAESPPEEAKVEAPKVEEAPKELPKSERDETPQEREKKVLATGLKPGDLMQRKQGVVVMTQGASELSDILTKKDREARRTDPSVIHKIKKDRGIDPPIDE